MNREPPSHRLRRRPRACLRAPLLAGFRWGPAAFARTSDLDARSPEAEVRVGARARRLHRVPAGLLRGELYVNTLRGHDVRDRRRHREGALETEGRRIEPLDPCDRRGALARRLQGRNGHRARSLEGPAVVAAAMFRRASNPRRSWSTESPYFGSHDGSLFAVFAKSGRFVGRTTPAGASTQARRCSAAACASRPTPDRSSASTRGRARSTGGRT